jgi:hypothetical protein
MTKPEQGEGAEMKAKEKVLAVWPDAKIVGWLDGACAVFSQSASLSLESGYIGWGQQKFNVSSFEAEKQAWQNAAESLPATPEQEYIQCRHCCRKIVKPEQICTSGYSCVPSLPPVEAKEMPRDQIDDFQIWWMKDGAYYDPDTEDIPWFDKRKELAAYAWNAAKGSEMSNQSEQVRIPDESAIGWKEIADGLAEQLRSVHQQTVNGRLCYFGNHTGYEPQFSSTQTERWASALSDYDIHAKDDLAERDALKAGGIKPAKILALPSAP